MCSHQAFTLYSKPIIILPLAYSQLYIEIQPGGFAVCLSVQSTQRKLLNVVIIALLCTCKEDADSSVIVYMRLLRPTHALFPTEAISYDYNIIYVADER